MNRRRPTEIAVAEGLREIARRRWRHRLTAAWLWAFAAWLAGGLMIVLVDAMSSIPTAGSVVVSLAWMGMPIIVLWRRWPRRVEPTPEALADARGLEVEHRLADSPLTNAVAMPGDVGDPYATALVDRARARGGRALAGLDTSCRLESQRPRRAGAYLWLVVVVALVMLMIQPRLFMAGLPRLTLPWAGNTPFSLTEVEAGFSPEPPYVDQPIDINATVTGVIPGEATLVELDGDGNPTRRLPMQPMNEGGFSFTLDGLSEPVTYRVESGAGRSEPFTIEPRPRPDPVASGQAAGNPGEQHNENASPREQAAALAAKAATLRDKVAATESGQTSPDTQREQSEAAAQLAKQLRELLPKLESSEQGRCESLAEALEDFAEGRSPGIGRSPAAGGDPDAPIDQGVIAFDGPGAAPLPIPKAAGAYDDTRAGSDTGDTPEAMANQAPATYRELVRLYLERLAEDEPRKDR